MTLSIVFLVFPFFFVGFFGGIYMFTHVFFFLWIRWQHRSRGVATNDQARKYIFFFGSLYSTCLHIYFFSFIF